MSSMYQLPQVFDGSKVPTPANIVYPLPNYHAGAEHLVLNGVASDVTAIDDESDEVRISAAQTRLIEQFRALNTRLDVFIKSKVAERPASTSAAPSTEAAPAAPEKSKKEAKKEQKKEQKKEAKQAGGAPKEEKGGDKAKRPTPPRTAAAATGRPFAVDEQRLVVGSTNSLPANIDATFVSFPRNTSDFPKNSNFKLVVTSADLPWVEFFGALGARRGVSFTGVPKSSFAGSTPAPVEATIDVQIGSKVSLSTPVDEVTARVSVWKWLGEILGLHNSSPAHVLHASHTHNWLLKFDRLMEDSNLLEETLREASQFLSRHDSLATQFHIALPDLILRSLLPRTPLASNVELWSGRVDKAFSLESASQV